MFEGFPDQRLECIQFALVSQLCHVAYVSLVARNVEEKRMLHFAREVHGNSQRVLHYYKVGKDTLGPEQYISLACYDFDFAERGNEFFQRIVQVGEFARPVA